MPNITNLGDVLGSRSREAEKIAFVDLRLPSAPTEWSYGKLDRLAGGVAAHISHKRLAQGSRVGILSLNRVEYVASYFGIMRAGCVAVPLNTKLPRETLISIVQDAGLILSFVDGAHRSHLCGQCDVVDFDDETDVGFHRMIEPTHFPGLHVGSHDPAEMLYTSGSSGKPKGVPLTHAGQIWALNALVREGSTGDQVQVIAQPLFHMNGLVVASLALMAGDTTVLLPKFDIETYMDTLCRYSITTVMAVPTMWARVMKEVDVREDPRLSAIRRISLGSGPASVALLDRTRALLPGAELTLSYGTTEAGPAVFGPHPEGWPLPPLSVGYPLPSSEVKLIDGVSPDQGVLLMRNPAVMSAYNNLPQRSAEVLQGGWYFSGDYMRRDERGFFYVVGRVDDMFVCSGENVYPGEVEKLLERHPSIHQAIVLSLPDEERGRIPVAFVVPRVGSVIIPSDVKSFALENGAPYLYPRRVGLLAEVPMTGTNKVDRPALQREAERLEASSGWSP